MLKRIVVGMSGATGQILGIRALEVLRDIDDIETHLVITRASEFTISQETEYDVDYVKSLADYVYDINDIGARIASGSFKTDGMIVIPCSIKTASAISNSYNDNLLIRAADVTIKEKRRLVLVVRESPFHVGHLEIMAKLGKMGAIVIPPIVAFYNKPKWVDDIVNHIVGRALDFFDIPHSLYKPWMGYDSGRDHC